MRFNLNLEDIKYLKILYMDNNGNPNTIKAAIKRFDSREILACVKYEKELELPIPQEITLSLVCSDGLYRTKTALKSFENAEPYIFLVLEPPQGLEYQQNREFFRVPAEYDCIYSIDLDGEIKSFRGKTYDISANGVSVILSEHLICEGDCYLEMNVEGIDLQTKVKYIRSESVENGYRLSFAYTQITQQDRDFISKVCIQNQLAQKRSI